MGVEQEGRIDDPEKAEAMATNSDNRRTEAALWRAEGKPYKDALVALDAGDLDKVRSFLQGQIDSREKGATYSDQQAENMEEQAAIDYDSEHQAPGAGYRRAAAMMRERAKSAPGMDNRSIEAAGQSSKEHYLREAENFDKIAEGIEQRDQKKEG